MSGHRHPADHLRRSGGADRTDRQGLSVGELLDWYGVPLMFSFTDFDGNRLYVMEAS